MSTKLIFHSLPLMFYYRSSANFSMAIDEKCDILTSNSVWEMIIIVMLLIILVVMVLIILVVMVLIIAIMNMTMK